MRTLDYDMSIILFAFIGILSCFRKQEILPDLTYKKNAFYSFRLEPATYFSSHRISYWGLSPTDVYVNYALYIS